MSLLCCFNVCVGGSSKFAGNWKNKVVAATPRVLGSSSRRTTAMATRTITTQTIPSFPYFNTKFEDYFQFIKNLSCPDTLLLMSMKSDFWIYRSVLPKEKDDFKYMTYCEWFCFAQFYVTFGQVIPSACQHFPFNCKIIPDSTSHHTAAWIFTHDSRLRLTYVIGISNGSLSVKRYISAS